MKLKYFTSLILLLAIVGVQAQTQIYIEDFETGTSGYTTSTSEAINGSTNYFTRTDGSDISASLSNIQGTFYFAAQDIDAATPSANQTLTIDDINIAGFTSLELRVYLAEDDDGSAQDWDAADFVHINYDIDNSSSFSNLLWVESDISSGSNGEPGIDTDFNGVADGTSLTDSFAQFTASITGTGSLLDLLIEFQLDSGDEDIAIDSIEIYGISAGGNIAPVITSIATSPTTPTDTDTVNVTADITDSDGTISTVTLNWGTVTGILPNSINMTVSSGDTYQTVSAIPAQSNGTTVFYTITATDDDSDSNTSAEQSYTLANQLPQITNVTRTPSTTVESTDTVIFTADITDADGTIGTVTFNWGTTSGSLGNSINMSVSSGDTYETDSAIPAQVDGTVVFYTITATDNDTESTTTNEASYTVTDPLNIDLIITEVADPSNSANSRFVELYNNGSTTIDFSSTTVFLALYANGNNSVNSQVQLTGTLAAGSFYVISGSNSSTFQSSYGFSPNLSSGVINANGNDVYALYGGGNASTGTLLDIYGQIGVDGSGETWEFEDARAYRNDLNDSPSMTWNAASWTVESSAGTSDMSPGSNEPVTYTWDGMSWDSAGSPEGVSTTSDNIVINGDYTITSASFSFNNLTVASSTTLSANTGTSITAAGNITNDGTIDINDSSLTLSGGSAQTLSGTGYTIGTLTVNNTNGVTVSASNAIEVITEFALTEGAVTSTDGITLNYDGTNGSADLTYTNGSINGTIVAERYVPVKSSSPVNATYRFLAPQLTSTQTIREAWQEDGASTAGFGTHITGSTTGANGFDITGSGSPSLLTYEPDTQGGAGAGWQFATSTQVNFATDQAYNLFIRGDRTFDLTNPSETPGSTTLRISGTPILGDKIMSASDLGGQFTLIPNPYAASVDVADILLNNSTNLDTNTFYMFDPNLNTSLNGVTGRGNFVTITAGSPTPSGSPATGIVESGHAFFVQTTANGAASLTFTEGAKDLNGATGTLGINNYPTPGFIDITLLEAQFNGIVDGAAINKFNGLAHTVKFGTGYENIFVRHNSTDYVHLNDLPLGDLSTAPIGLRNTAAKDYILIITNLPSGTALLDTLTGISYSPAEMATGITFTGLPALDETTRFVVNSVASIDNINTLSLSMYPNPATDIDQVTITGLGSVENVKVNMSTMSGQLVFEGAVDVSNSRIELPVEQLQSGIYLIQVSTGDSQQTLKLVKN